MKFLKDNRGMELLEAAITTPIAIMVMLAIVNLGMLVYAQQAVQAAARHGARMGSVAQQCPACYAVSGAKSAIAPLTSLFPGLPGQSFTVRADSTFRQEGW